MAKRRRWTARGSAGAGRLRNWELRRPVWPGSLPQVTEPTWRKPQARVLGISRPVNALLGVMRTMERRAYKYRCQRTEEEAREPARSFGCVRYVYSRAFTLRTEARFERHERGDHAETDRLPVRMKREADKAWLAEVSCVPLQQALSPPQRCVRQPLRGPRQVPALPAQARPAERAISHRGFRWRDANLTLAKVDAPLDIRWTRPVGGEPTSVTVSRDPAGREEVNATMDGSPRAGRPLADPGAAAFPGPPRCCGAGGALPAETPPSGSSTIQGWRLHRLAAALLAAAFSLLVVAARRAGRGLPWTTASVSAWKTSHCASESPGPARDPAGPVRGQPASTKA